MHEAQAFDVYVEGYAVAFSTNLRNVGSWWSARLIMAEGKPPCKLINSTCGLRSSISLQAENSVVSFGRAASRSQLQMHMKVSQRSCRGKEGASVFTGSGTGGVASHNKFAVGPISSNIEMVFKGQNGKQQNCLGDRARACPASG